jgi:hypothetical protein
MASGLERMEAMADEKKAVRVIVDRSARQERVREILEKKPVWEAVDEILGPVPAEERDRIPHDGSINHDHYQ